MADAFESLDLLNGHAGKLTAQTFSDLEQRFGTTVGTFVVIDSEMYVGVNQFVGRAGSIRIYHEVLAKEALMKLDKLDGSHLGRITPDYARAMGVRDAGLIGMDEDSPGRRKIWLGGDSGSLPSIEDELDRILTARIVQKVFGQEVKVELLGPDTIYSRRNS